MPKIKPLTTFQDILIQGIRANHYPMQGRKARDWFRKTASEFKKSPNALIAEGKLVQNLQIGDMLIYRYDAKWKDKLPYWDAYPVIFVVEIYGDGSFLGINLHYLPPILRAQLMDALYSLVQIKKESIRLGISYQILKRAAKFDPFSPCLKKYLLDHVVSGGFIRVEMINWDIALFLPIARFQKQSESTVWRDSEEKIRSRKVKNVWFRRVWRGFKGQGFGRK